MSLRRFFNTQATNEKRQKEAKDDIDSVRQMVDARAVFHGQKPNAYINAMRAFDEQAAKNEAAKEEASKKKYGSYNSAC